MAPTGLLGKYILWEFSRNFKALDSSFAEVTKERLVSVSLFSGVISIVIKKLLMVVDET